MAMARAGQAFTRSMNFAKPASCWATSFLVISSLSSSVFSSNLVGAWPTKIRTGCDVLELLLAGILKGDIEPALSVFLYPPRNANAARFRQCFETRRHVHPVAMDAAAVVDNDVAKVDPDSEFDPRLAGHLSIPLDHSALDVNSATQRVDNTRKQHEQAIAGGPHNSAAEFLDFGNNQSVVEVFQVGVRALVIGAYQPAVADDVGYKNGHQTPLDAFAHQRSLHHRRNRPTTRRPAV